MARAETQVDATRFQTLGARHDARQRKGGMMVDFGGHDSTSTTPTHAPTFAVGDRVRHQNFGNGRVEHVRETCGQYHLFVRFERTSIWVPGLHVRKLLNVGTIWK